MYKFNNPSVGQKQPFTVNSTFVICKFNTDSSYAYCSMLLTHLSPTLYILYI